MPSAAEDYLEELVISLRLRDVPAADIEDVVDEIAAHLESSGQHPESAFGAPEQLAGDLARARGYGAKASTVVRGSISGLVIVAGFVLALSGLLDGLTGDPAQITLGTVAMLVVLGVGIPLMVGPLGRLLYGRGRVWWLWVSGFALVWVAALAVQLLLRQVVLTLATPVAVGVGLPLMALGGWLTWRSRDPLRSMSDPTRGTLGRRQP